jgi:hypothetical protein
MCEACSEYPDKSGYIDCKERVEWPDDPWTTEQRVEEAHGWALMEKNNPERAEAILDDIGHRECDHANHHVMVQDWQGVDLLVKVCNSCGATVRVDESWENA